MLTSQKRTALRQQAHHLKPVVLLGQHGLTPTVHQEIDRGLTDHQLIKVRIPAVDHAQRDTWIQEMCTQHEADLVQTIGHIAVLYRPLPDDKRKK